MAERSRDVRHGIIRGFDRVFDAFGARPLGIVVFFASVALLLYLQTGVRGAFRAEAVAHAPGVDHPALVASFVTRLYVRPGDHVEVGAPLVELSPHFIDRELQQVDAEIAKLLHESRLAQARLLVEEQRWLAPGLRADRPSLERPTEALYEKSLATLHLRRDQLLEQRSALTVASAGAGQVMLVSTLGSSVAPGSSVATVSPEYAQEIVAYVPAQTAPASIEVGAPVQIARGPEACRNGSLVVRRGAAVQEAPGQLRSIFRFPVHGMPVYLSIPDECQLAVGQVLTVEFARSVL